MDNRKALLAGLAIALTAGFAPAADLPMVVTGLTGTLRIQQPIPCSGHIDQMTPVTGGRIDITPAEGVPAAGGGRTFGLTRANIRFAAFSVSGSCLGISETDTYSEVHVSLSRALTFTALPTASPGVFSFTIPRSSFRIDYATTVDGNPDTGVRQPRDDVTGTIDLGAGTVRVRVVLGTHVTFRALCVDDACAINETHDGSLTADVVGSIAFPDVDGDGVPDRTDNCRYGANPDQSPVATPTLVVPADITLASCASRAFGAASAADVCDGRPVTVTSNAPLQFDAGANVVVWSAADAAGRTATDTQLVTIVDTTPPTFTSVPLNLSLSDCSAAALGAAAATDDCAGDVTLSNDAPAIFYVGSTPVTWTARDAAGNVRTAIQTVTVVDTTPPAVTCEATNPTGSSFRVSAVDRCLGAPVIRLGGFVLGEGEVIMINETGRPGVRHMNDLSTGNIRHFQVGRGEAIISATDASGNVATTACPVR